MVFGYGSVLIDNKSRIKPLPNLNKFIIQCKSIGNNFFSDIIQFSPNVEFLWLYVGAPRYQFTNQYLIALSECKLMNDLKIEFKTNILENEIEPEVDDIGLIPLIDNCKQLKRIELNFKVDSIIKLNEVISDSIKRSITFQTCFSSDQTKTVLSDMSRLENLKSLEVLDDYDLWGPLDDCGLIRVMFDKLMTISVFIATKSYFKDRTDVWQTLCRYRDLERLRISVFNDIEKWTLNIEPLIKLKEISFESETLNEYFFDDLTKLAPNVEELELRSQLKLTNNNLIELSQLKCLTRICLVSTEKKEHSVDDIGFIQLLDNCQKLREVILDLELNLTFASIDKLIEMANRIINSERPKDVIRFECFVSSPELQSNRLKSLPKNLIIQTKFVINF